MRVYDDHVDDVRNLAHPSSFDSTDAYELDRLPRLGPAPEGTERIKTRPMFLFNFDRVLLTVGATPTAAR